MSTEKHVAPEAEPSEKKPPSRRSATGPPSAPIVHHAAPVALEILSGVAAGAVTGAVAGPPGIVAGAVLGGMAGAAAVVALDEAAAMNRAKDEQLDEDIGVVGGDLGNVQPMKEEPVETRSAEDQFFEGPLEPPKSSAPEPALAKALPPRPRLPAFPPPRPKVPPQKPPLPRARPQ
jgi:hypothetical protein